MKRSRRPSTASSLLVATAGVAATAGLSAFLVGCVNLDKPDSVRRCASQGGCFDNPDAAVAGPDGPGDTRVNDAFGAGSDAPGPDAVVVPDLPVEAMRDTADGPGATDEPGVAVDPDAGDSRSGGGPDVVDLRPAPDLASPDVLEFADLAPDLAISDGVPDQSQADVRPDVAGDRVLPTDLPFDLGSDQAAACIATIVSNGYKAGTAPACSACTDGNGGSLASKCTDMVNCLGTQGPVFTNCLNAVAGSSRVGDCVSALTKAAGCPAGYY